MLVFIVLSLASFHTGKFVISKVTDKDLASWFRFMLLVIF